MRLYKESEKSTFSYWFAHWMAFQKTAIKLKVWRPAYLLHDIEKPFIMCLWKDYPKVREFHRTHNKHHYEYDNGEIAPWLSCDYTAMAIDWECSHLTKEDAQALAYEECCNKLEKAFNDKNPVVLHILINYLIPELEELGLCAEGEFEKSDLGKKILSSDWKEWDGNEAYFKMYGRLAPDEI